ncbi:outer membrane beta-barrel protein [Agaribacterium haliotis]|uniref:outer membrane beta-barrel protein n=1 Tax=Agaribacterium haliotis TaxID=2013869 RepID=UPI000BB55C71|nr:outer membrane beta-barrel protein [Agaribacterium haliotis]
MRQLLALSLALVLSAASHANNRQLNNIDFAFVVPWDYSTDIDFENNTDAAIEGNHGFGLAFGYSWSDQLSTRFDVIWNHQDYSGTRIYDKDGIPTPEKIRSRLDSIRLDLGADYYLTTGKSWAPFIGATVGWDFLDSNIPKGDPNIGCWWDPIWGWMCQGYQNTYTETAWHLGWNAGFRFDLGSRYFARILYGERYLDLNKAEDSYVKFPTSRFELGWSY